MPDRDVPVEVQAYVTRGLLDRGWRCDPHRCALALAIERVLAPGYSAAITWYYIAIHHARLPELGWCADTPGPARRLVADIDAGRPVVPTIVRIELPARCVHRPSPHVLPLP